MVIYIDASDTILGRLASYVAKEALHNNEEIIIVNCEQVVISGNRKNIINEYLMKRQRGDRYKGPFYPIKPDRIVRRVIRGMLPYKTKRGKDAFKKIRTYIGIPKELEGVTFTKLNGILKDKLKLAKYVYLEEISRYLG